MVYAGKPSQPYGLYVNCPMCGIKNALIVPEQKVFEQDKLRRVVTLEPGFQCYDPRCRWNVSVARGEFVLRETKNTP